MIYTFTANPSVDRTFVVDEVTLGAYNRGVLTKLDPGGKGINVSRNLRIMGEESIVTGFFGGGTGSHILSILMAEGYKVLSLELEKETRSNITLIEKNLQRYSKFNELGPEVGEEEFQILLRLLKQRLKQDDILVLSGSLLPGLPENAYAQIIYQTKQLGGKTFLDTSGAPLYEGCQAKPYCVHMNLKEAQAYSGDDLSDRDQLIKMIKNLLDLPVDYVIISSGSQGAVLGSIDGIVEAVPASVEVVNPVGAGDAMMAGLVYGVIQDWDSEKIIKWSVAAGTSSALGEGTSVVDLEIMNQLMDTMDYQELV